MHVHSFIDGTCQPDNATCVTEVRNAIAKFYLCIHDLFYGLLLKRNLPYLATYTWSGNVINSFTMISC